MSHFKHALLFLIISGVTAPSADAQASNRKFSLNDFPDLDWSGPYLGATAGYLSSFKGTGTISADFNGEMNPEAKGFTGGVYVGYNIQSGNFVYGAELDANLSSASGIKSISTDAVSASLKLTQRESASLRARFGYLFGDTLVYVGAGISAAKIGSIYSNTVIDTTSLAVVSSDQSNIQKQHLGLTFGLGLDYALTPNVIARTEYRYTKYEQKSHDVDKIGADSHEWRAGLAYKF